VQRLTAGVLPAVGVPVPAGMPHPMAHPGAMVPPQAVAAPQQMPAEEEPPDQPQSASIAFRCALAPAATLALCRIPPCSSRVDFAACFGHRVKGKSTQSATAPPPRAARSFPPGLIPELVKDKATYADSYSPISPLEIERMGLPPQPEKVGAALGGPAGMPLLLLHPGPWVPLSVACARPALSFHVLSTLLYPSAPPPNPVCPPPPFAGRLPAGAPAPLCRGAARLAPRQQPRGL
jgi:hypothetical protein